MTPSEREAFLTQPRIALTCIEQQSRAPLAVPIWYGYAPEVGVWIATTEASLKAKRLDAAGRFTLVVHDEGGSVPSLRDAARGLEDDGPVEADVGLRLRRTLGPVPLSAASRSPHREGIPKGRITREGVFS